MSGYSTTAISASCIARAFHLTMEMTMPKHTVSSDRSTPWIINKSGHTWILEKQALISVSSGDAVVIDDGFDKNKLELFGDIVASGSAASAIQIDGDRTTIRLGDKASIGAEQAIAGVGDRTRIINNGDISGDTVAIAQNEHFRIVNNGEVHGGYGISVAQADMITNGRHGLIRGSETGILLFGDGASTIVNKGMIEESTSGDTIVDEDGSVTIRNTGTILGNIAMGGGNDTFDNRGGTFEGHVSGGEGDDRYWMSDDDAEIVEQGGQGYDTIHSSVSMDLPLNIDKLVLTGKKDIDAMGGGDNITIIGNRGDNVIIGLGGTNNLMGGAGRDEITGGIDADNFLFKSNADKEIILDFEDGIDRIVFFPTKNIDAVADIQDHLEQHGADVWIRAAGTIMVVRNIEQNQLTDADFDMVST